MAELDHLVYAVTDLPGAVDDLEHRLGVRPSPGGRHIGRGTRNELLALDAGAYLEVIGADDGQPAPPTPRPFGIDDLDAARLVTWAVRVPDIDVAIAAARAAGYDPGPAHAMSRATPGGDVLSWRLTDACVLGDGIVPFLIEWGDTVHPSRTAATGGVRLGLLSAEHPEPGPVLAALRALGLLDRAPAAISVTAGSTARLTAIVRGPAGAVTLT